MSCFVFGTWTLPPVPAGGRAIPTLRGIIGNFWWLAFLATFFGIVLTQVIGKITEYFTAAEHEAGDGDRRLRPGPARRR